MVIMGFFLWWYSDGWKRLLRVASDKLASIFDYFSIDLLVRSLFSPFRQISAGSVQGPLPVQLRAFVDQLFSRVIGAVVRTIMIFIGTISIIGAAIYQLLKICLWAVVPVLPLVGLVMMFIGWTP